MVADIYAVMWKEMKQLLEGGGGRGRLWPLIFVGVFGVVMPLQMGRNWLDTPVGLVLWVMIPLFVVSSWVADSFAGERERHTLESLLATRLSDRAILFGKIAVGAGHAWLLGLLAMALGLIAVNVANWEGSVLLYPTQILAGGVVLSFLFATLGTSAGVLVSLRAATVRQAQQAVGLGLFAVAWTPILALNFLPNEMKRALGNAVMSADIAQIEFAVAGILAVLDLLLLAAVMARFRRTRLIVD